MCAIGDYATVRDTLLVFAFLAADETMAPHVLLSANIVELLISLLELFVRVLLDHTSRVDRRSRLSKANRQPLLAFALAQCHPPQLSLHSRLRSRDVFMRKVRFLPMHILKVRPDRRALRASKVLPV